MAKTKSNLAECLPLSKTQAGQRGVLPCRPFVKWAGGKSQLLAELLARVPHDFSKYYEPFVGGGALLFALQPKQASIMDINADLINAYCAIKQNVEELIRNLKKHKYERTYYYRLRGVDREPEFKNWGAIQRAGRFIYLNKTCYNGLYRVNSKGFFNVPFGRYLNPKIVDPNNMRACRTALQGVEIRQGDFYEIEEEITSSDFVYFDPPYVPLSATSCFTAYSAGGFDIKMQKELAALCARLDRRGVRFLLSNSAARLVRDLYQKFKIETVTANRAVNSKADRRGKIEELIVRNYEN